MPDLKKEYFFSGNTTGVLVIHGFTSTPAEVYELGLRLHQEGYTVLGVRLKGHGTDVADFAQATEADWIASAEEGLQRLRKNCKKVYVAGHSMGGLLALILAERAPVDKLILLAPAALYRRFTPYLAGILQHIIKTYTWPDQAWDQQQRQYLLGYKSFPLSGVHKMTKLQRLALSGLDNIKAPVLLIMARRDELVHIKAARVLARGITSPLKTVWLEKSGHSVGVDCEKEKVFTECVSFLRR